MSRFGFSLSVALFFVSALPAHAQQFGGSLAISGDQVMVGESRNASLPGIVYVFRLDGGEWREIAQLMADDAVGPPDGFGRALAADERTMLVGAPVDDDGAGAAFLFEADASGSWTEIARLSALDGETDAAFGSAVALRDDVAVVAAPGDNEGAGSVYVFRRDAGGSWTQSEKLEANDSAGRAFGTTLALDGRTILVASADQRETLGVVHAFRLDPGSGAWAAQGTLEADGLSERSGYGASLALRGDLALIGAPNSAQRMGTVFVFRHDADRNEWISDGLLAPFDVQPNLLFGASIAFEGSTAWIGAPGDAGGTGAFYLFGGDDSGDWVSAAKLVSRTLDGRASFASTAAIRGNLLVAGAAGVDSRAGAAVIFERNGAGDWLERNTVVNEMRGLPAITGAEVECVDDSAAGYECSNVNVVSFLPIKDMGGTRGTMVNDIWGWTDPTTGREYAIVGRSDGTAFVDISDPYNPEYLGNLPKTDGSRSSVWRDMKVYRDHVYIVADAANQHGMQVFDLRQLHTVRSAPMTFEPTFTYDGIHSAHNIVINEETGYAYSVGSSSGGETCGGGLHMISLQDPGRPTFAGCFADATTGRRKTGYSHDAQCVAYRGPDADHQGKEICLGSNETAFSIADVSDKDNPIAIASVSYPNVAYTHQGWLTEDHRYFYQNDEGDEPQGLVEGTRTLVWDLTDLDDPVLVKEHIASTTTTDHNLYVRGDLMYQSNYGSGLRILDVSDPANPVEIGFFDTTPYGGGGSWSNYPFFESGMIVATSMGDGLFVLKNTRRPRLIP